MNEYWVAEIQQKVPPSILISNYYSQEYNIRMKNISDDQFLPGKPYHRYAKEVLLQPEIPCQCVRLTGPQMSLLKGQ